MEEWAALASLDYADRSHSQGWSEVFPSAPYFVEEEEIEIRLIHS